jgi:hypothetical protein
MSEMEDKAKSRKPIKRKWVIALFVGGIAVCAVLVGLWVYARRPKVTDGHPGPWRCFINLCILGKAMNMYAGENDGQYPTADKWCDLLLAGDYVSFKRPDPFACRRSGAIEVESSFALNINVAGRKPSEIGPDVVLLFETNSGINPLGRQGRVKDRQFPDWLFAVLRLDREARVYKLRWNQVGGPEILTTEYHDGEGCMVLFNNGRVDFVRAEQLGTLKWNAEQSR